MADQDTPPPTITAMKIPIIKKEEYDIWSMRMRQYICHTDHNLWDIIVNRDLEDEATPSGEQSSPPVPKTAKQLAARRNQERIKSILLLAIPDEYLLKFHNVSDAKSLWATIKSRFGGNEESKKMQKNVLKHQFKKFVTPSNETLDKAYDRFQKLISPLEIHGAYVSKEDINQKFLRSLPLSWSQIALIMRNKPDIDDLYNNLRVYKDELKRSSGSNSASKNLAFLSSENTNSTNEVSTASGDIGVSTAGGINQVPTTPSAHDIAYSFLAQPTTSPQLENEDFQQMDGDDLEVAARSERSRAWWPISGRSQGRRPYRENGRSNAQITESSSQALVAQDGLGGYDWSNDFEIELVNYALMAISSSNSSSSFDSEGYEIALESLEARILGHEKNELAWGERYEFQNYDLKCREIKINNLNLELEKVVKERDELKLKIEKWEGSSKNLTKILNSQMSTHDKNGLGFGTQMDDLSNKSKTDSENSLTIFEVRSSDEESTLANNRFPKANGYHAVPPPIKGNFLTQRADISFAGLDEYAIRKKIIELKTTESKTELKTATSESKTSETVGKTNEVNVEKPKSVYESVVSKPKINRDKVIIEDWNSDDEDDVSEVSPETQTVKTQVDKIGNTSGSVEDSMQLKELMVLVPTLVTRINSLETELKETKQTLGNVVLKLVKNVKSLEIALKRKSKKGVSKEKLTDKGKRYRGRARSMAKNIDTGLDDEEEINTGREEINTGIEKVSTGSTKVDSGTANKRGKREGKAPMIEEDIQATHKTKEQIRQEEAGLEEAIKLQAQLDEEVAKQIHLDKMIAERMAEEEALTE
ncbi:hypothetical protein Tco_0322239 [Tanacetum coccineum]